MTLPVSTLPRVTLAGARGARVVLRGLARCTWCVRSLRERHPCSDVPRLSARQVDRRDPCRCVTAGDRRVPRGTSLPVRGVARGAWTAGGTLTLPQRTGGPRARRDTRLAPRPALLPRAPRRSRCARCPRRGCRGVRLPRAGVGLRWRRRRVRVAARGGGGGGGGGVRVRGGRALVRGARAARVARMRGPRGWLTQGRRQEGRAWAPSPRLPPRRRSRWRGRRP